MLLKDYLKTLSKAQFPETSDHLVFYLDVFVALANFLQQNNAYFLYMNRDIESLILQQPNHLGKRIIASGRVDQYEKSTQIVFNYPFEPVPYAGTISSNTLLVWTCKIFLSNVLKIDLNHNLCCKENSLIKAINQAGLFQKIYLFFTSIFIRSESVTVTSSLFFNHLPRTLSDMVQLVNDIQNKIDEFSLPFFVGTRSIIEPWLPDQTIVLRNNYDNFRRLLQKWEKIVSTEEGKDILINSPLGVVVYLFEDSDMVTFSVLFDKPFQDDYFARPYHLEVQPKSNPSESNVLWYEGIPEAFEKYTTCLEKTVCDMDLTFFPGFLFLRSAYDLEKKKFKLSLFSSLTWDFHVLNDDKELIGFLYAPTTTKSIDKDWKNETKHEMFSILPYVQKAIMEFASMRQHQAKLQCRFEMLMLILAYYSSVSTEPQRKLQGSNLQHWVTRIRYTPDLLLLGSPFDMTFLHFLYAAYHNIATVPICNQWYANWLSRKCFSKHLFQVWQSTEFQTLGQVEERRSSVELPFAKVNIDITYKIENSDPKINAQFVDLMCRSIQRHKELETYRNRTSHDLRVVFSIGQFHEEGQGNGLTQEALTMFKNAILKLGLFHHPSLLMPHQKEHIHLIKSSPTHWYSLGVLFNIAYMHYYSFSVGFPLFFFKAMIHGPDHVALDLHDLYAVDPRLAEQMFLLYHTPDISVLCLSLDDGTEIRDMMGVQRFVTETVHKKTIGQWEYVCLQMLHKGFTVSSLDRRPIDLDLYLQYGHQVLPSLMDLVDIFDINMTDITPETESELRKHRHCFKGLIRMTEEEEVFGCTCFPGNACTYSRLSRWIQQHYHQPELISKFFLFVTGIDHIYSMNSVLVNLVVDNNTKDRLPTASVCNSLLYLFVAPNELVVSLHSDLDRNVQTQFNEKLIRSITECPNYGFI